MTSKRSLALTVLLASLLASGPALAQHEHGDAAAGSPKPTLDKGKKWRTDAPLREGMTAVRDDVAAALAPIHAGTYPAAKYEALAARIETQVASIMKNCKLPPDADAQLHLVLAELLAGTHAMKGPGSREGGAVKVVRSLDTYATYFEHAGWKPLVH